MRKLFKLVAVLALINLAAIDFTAWRIDRGLILSRDIACDERDEIRQTPRPAKTAYEAGLTGLTGLYIDPYAASSFDLMRIDVIDTREKGSHRQANFHLYGCDANGKRFRFWAERY